MITAAAFFASLAPVAAVTAYWSIRRRSWPGNAFFVTFSAMAVVFLLLGLALQGCLAWAQSLPLTGLPRLVVLAALLQAVPEELIRMALLLVALSLADPAADMEFALSAGLGAGLGAAAIENLVAVVPSADWAGSALARGLSVVPAHACWGMIMAAWLFLALRGPGGRRRAWACLAAGLVPVALHSVYDVCAFSLARYPASAAVGTLVLAVTAGLAIAVQGRPAPEAPAPAGRSRAMAALGLVLVTGGSACLAGALGPTVKWAVLTPMLAVMPILLGSDLVRLSLLCHLPERPGRAL